VGFGLLMLACSITVRCIVTFLAVGCRGLRMQERLFTALAWMPKATVQAAIGAVALDEAKTEKEKEMGRDILAIAVLAILCTAPVGAAIISVTGPRLLLKEEKSAGDAYKDGALPVDAEAIQGFNQKGTTSGAQETAPEPAAATAETGGKASVAIAAVKSLETI